MKRNSHSHLRLQEIKTTKKNKGEKEKNKGEKEKKQMWRWEMTKLSRV